MDYCYFAIFRKFNDEWCNMGTPTNIMEFNKYFDKVFDEVVAKDSSKLVKEFLTQESEKDEAIQEWSDDAWLHLLKTWKWT